jgi:hypothetical protein
MPSIDQTWVLASIGAVVEMGRLSTLKRLLMESTSERAPQHAQDLSNKWSYQYVKVTFFDNFCVPPLVTEVVTISP